MKGTDVGTAQLGITTTRETNFSEWYTECIVKAELVEYYDISGCYILRPSAFHMWETVSKFFDKLIKDAGVEGCYFPMFVSKAKLEVEANHVEGFAPEVAWVTKYGDSDLAEPIAIRPTSETIMYPAFAKWIRSHRDLPLKLNQWCPIVRWEFSHPTPFIRTREFLWQEGHTAHATLPEASEWALLIQDYYRKTYEELLAVPVIPGTKSEKEKFAGSHYTLTVEAFIPHNGRAVQGATSHNLGQNFSKMFGIDFENENGEKENVWQTSWGLTTRSIGVAIMVHGDDKGLVLPPKVVKIQAVFVPIVFKGDESGVVKSHELADILKIAGIRVHVDDRATYKPGWKYNHWEVKGVPLRIECGPKDVKKESVVVVRRDTGEKIFLPWANLANDISDLLQKIQEEMFLRALEIRDSSVVKLTSKDGIMDALEKKNLILLPWCGSKESEEEIKNWTQKESEKLVSEGKSINTGGMKSLCFPLKQDPLPADTRCFWTGKQGGNQWCLFGRSY